MAKQGRPRGKSSFGKRQGADDDFRKKKREGNKRDGDGTSKGGKFRSTRSSSSSTGGGDRRRPGSGSSFGGPRRGSSYEGGRRKFNGDSDRGEGFKPRSGGFSRGGDRNRSSPGDSEKGPFRPRRSPSSGGFGAKRSFGGDRNESRGGGFKSRGGFDRDDRRKPDSDSESRGGFRDRRSGDDSERPKRSFEGGERRERRATGGDRREGGPRRESGPGRERRSPGGDRREGGFSNRKSGFSRDNRDDRDESKGEGDFKKREPRERKSFIEGKVSEHKSRVDTSAEAEGTTADSLIRLNKFISNSGVCSRREADELIKMGLISVNGTTITEMGYKVKSTDDVRHEGKKLTAERPVYILLNKPKGFITTTDDPQERNTVMELISGACKERVYPVGRLDRNTTGLLLLTNDGDLTDKLTHPSFNARKIYKVELDKPLAKDDFQKILDGIKLDEGKAMVDDLAIVSDDGKTVGIELHIGWNHIVRRIFDALEYSVVKLDRVVYAGLDKKDLKRGQWRFLKTDEIVRLKHFK